MYRVRPYFEIKKIKLPDCMYPLKALHQLPNVSPPSQESVTSSLTYIEERQDKMLAQLGVLQAKVNTLGEKLGVSNVNASKPKEQVSMAFRVHLHSSLLHTHKANTKELLLRFFEGVKPDCSSKPLLRLTLIWKSDVLLIAIPINKNKKTYKLRERVQLVQSWATDTLGKGSERGFSFGTPLRTYHFLASSPEEKTAWFSDIYANILTQKQLLSKGLYKEEPFDPTPEWYFGTFKGNMGWFPASCVHPEGKQQMEPTPEQLHPPTMRTVLSLRQRMVELTGRQILPLSSEGRIAKVSLGDDTSKTLRIADEWPIETVIETFFKVIPEGNYAWSLSEQSVDGTVDRLLELDELPSSVVDFWGKNKDQMKLVIKQTLINTTECSECIIG
eukprot:Em0020g279a